MFRHGDAYEKVQEELVRNVSELASQDFNGLESPEEMTAFFAGMGGQAILDLTDTYMFGGSLREFTDLRSIKRATAITKGLDFTDVQATFDLLTADLFGLLQEDILSMFAMGYTFHAPEYAGVSRDKEGFVHLCSVVDRTVIRVLVTQLKTDDRLLEQMSNHMDSVAALVSAQFSAQHRPYHRFSVRDWLSRVLSMCSFEAFFAGAKVRELLEQEVEFESMMKELGE